MFTIGFYYLITTYWTLSVTRITKSMKYIRVYSRGWQQAAHGPNTTCEPI